MSPSSEAANLHPVHSQGLAHVDELLVPDILAPKSSNSKTMRVVMGGHASLQRKRRLPEAGHARAVGENQIGEIQSALCKNQSPNAAGRWSTTSESLRLLVQEANIYSFELRKNGNHVHCRHR